MRREKIMIVDESLLILEAIGSALREAGYEVITRSVSIGTSAAILREKPALVLLDVAMPLMTAAEISDSLRASSVSHDTLIVLHSDRSTAELDQLTRRCGATGYLHKSAERRELLSEVARFLAQGKRGALTPVPETRRRRVLVAGSTDTLDWARRTLGPLVPVHCTDSGTEAFRLITTGSGPRAALLGTSLLDLPAVRLWERAVRMNARWKQNLIVIDEPGAPPLAGPSEMMRWATTDPVRTLLERLELRGQGT